MLKEKEIAELDAMLKDFPEDERERIIEEGEFIAISRRIFGYFTGTFLPALLTLDDLVATLRNNVEVVFLF